MKSSPYIGILLLTACVGLSSLPSCRKKEASRESVRIPEIAVSRPEVRSIVLHKAYPGYLASEQTVDLVARVNGYLEQVLYTPGQLVRKGELLFVIEPTLYRDNVIQAEAALKKGEAALVYARSSYDRMKEAAGSKAVSEIELIQAESNVKQAQAAVETARSALAQARTDLSYCYVRAPFDGHITRNQEDVGAYVSGAGQSVTLATIYKDTRMYAYFNIEDNQFLLLNYSDSAVGRNGKGAVPVEIRFKEKRSKSYTGYLDYVSPNVNRSTGTLNLRAWVENPDGALKSGLYITVNLPYGRNDRAVLIRDASIGTDQLGKFIYVVNDSDEVAYRPVTLGELVDDTLREIASGLTPDERYVTRALLKVRSGMRINPITD